MMSTYVNKAIVLIAIIAIQKAQAQYKPQSIYSRWEVGAGLSGFVYQGDLTPRRIGSIETIKPGLTVFGNYKLKNQLRLQAAFAIGSLKGNDAVYVTPQYRRERNFAFTTPVKDFSIGLQYQIHKAYLGDEALLYPYIGVGLGVSIVNIKKDYSSLTTKLATAEPQILTGLIADNNKGTPRTIINIPLTVGVRKMYNQRFDFFAEAKYRWMQTDYLDGFSQAAGSKYDDKYYSINVGANYKFYSNKGIKCPTY
jgi:hypothetical protein